MARRATRLRATSKLGARSDVRIALVVFALLVGLVGFGAPRADAGLYGSSPFPSSAPSLFPFVSISPPATAYPTAGTYLVAPQGAPTNLPTPGGTPYYWIGTKEGTLCYARIAVALVVATPVATTEPTTVATTAATTIPTTFPGTPYPATYATSVPTTYATMWPQPSASMTTPNGITELCSYSGNALNYFNWDAPNYFNIQSSTEQTGVSINGQVYAMHYTTYGSTTSLRIPRNIGWTYTGTTYYIGGTTNEGTFSISAPSVAAQTTSQPQQWAPVKSFLGAFARVDGTAYYGIHALNTGNTNTPNPYPAPTTLLYGSTGYCDEQDGSGRSIVNTNYLDFYKAQDLVQLGVQFTRTVVNPRYMDLTHNGGGYNYSDMDSAICGIVRNGIEPVIELDAGQVLYSGVSNNLYKNPTDYATYVTQVVTRISQTFPTVYRFECGINEPNGGGWDASLTDNPTLYGGPGGLALYTRACYTAIKAIIPNAVVYWGLLDMDASAAPLTWITGMYAAGCRIGYCFDGTDVHFSPENDPLAYYAPYPTDPGFTGDGYDIRAFDAMIATMQASPQGETRPIHFIIGESLNCPTVPTTTNQQCGNPGDMAFLAPRWLSFAQQNTQLNIDGISIANLDDDELYGTIGVFANNGLMQTLFTPVLYSWNTSNLSSQPTPSPRPAYAAIQQYMGINPASPPTVAPSTAPTP